MKIQNAKIRYTSNSKVEEKLNRVSAFSENYREEIYYINVDKLIPYHNQARKAFDQEELIELANTIKSHGIRQPLTIIAAKNQQGFFEIVSGERRLRAAKIAGLEKVPCIIIHDEIKAEEIAIIENIHRQNLRPLELGKAYYNLISSGICSSKNDVAKRLGISRSKVIDCIALCELSENIQNLILKYKVDNRDFLRDLCKVKDEVIAIQKIEEKYNHLNNQIDKKKDINKRNIKRKYIIQAFFDNDQIIINHNKMLNLSLDQKEKFREDLKKILFEL